MNHTKSTALERSVIGYWGRGLNMFYSIQTSIFASAMVPLNKNNYRYENHLTSILPIFYFIIKHNRKQSGSYKGGHNAIILQKELSLSKTEMTYRNYSIGYMGEYLTTGLFVSGCYIFSYSQ